MKEDDITIKNKIRIRRIVELLNERQIDELKKLFHPNIRMELFSILEGKIVTIRGINDVISTIKDVGGRSDVNYEITEIFVNSSNRILVRMISKGSLFIAKGGYVLDEYFEDDIMYIMDFKESKVARMELFRDSFKILQKYGRAVMKSDDPKMIQNYIDKLNEFGILIIDNKDEDNR